MKLGKYTLFLYWERVWVSTGLIVPPLFEEKWRDTVFGFPWGVVRGAWCVVPSF